MKRKTRFNDGGSTGRFDEDLYARARRFVEEQEQRAGEGLALPEDEMPKPRTMRAPVKPPAVSDSYRDEGMGRAPRVTNTGEIPTGGITGPAKRSSPAMEMSDTGRALATTMGALAPGVARAAAPVGRGIGALASSAREGWREGERIKEVARAAERGAKSRAEVQAKRTARQKSEAEALEKAKPVLQSRKSSKPERMSRTRYKEDEAGMEFAKGGVTRGDGIAKRGKTRGKMY